MSKTYVIGAKLHDLFFKGWKNGFRKMDSKLQMYPDDDTISDNFRDAFIGNGIPIFSDNATAVAALGIGKMWQDDGGKLYMTKSE